MAGLCKYAYMKKTKQIATLRVLMSSYALGLASSLVHIGFTPTGYLKSHLRHISDTGVRAHAYCGLKGITTTQKGKVIFS